MSETSSSGPVISSGPMKGVLNAPDTNFHAGPSILFQGAVVPDPRIVMDVRGIGSVRAHLLSAPCVDAIPAAATATPVNIAAAANAVSGVAMVLAGASAGITPAVPFYPFGSGTLAYSGLTLDFGFAVVATTAASKVVTPAAGTIGLFTQGQRIVVGNVGNAGGSACLVTSVGAVGATTLTLADAAQATNAAAPVGQGNILSPISSTPAAAAMPYMAGGIAALLNPGEVIARGVGIAGSASATGGAFLVSGYDVYLQPMSETVTHPGSTAVQYGKKAFKHIASVVPQFSDAHAYSVGTSDVFGFPLRNDRWEHNTVYMNAAELTVATGWTAADVTSPATSATGDVRGTVQFGTLGPLGSGASGGPSNGTKRLTMYANIPAYNMVAATPVNPAPMYGSTQA